MYCILDMTFDDTISIDQHSYMICIATLFWAKYPWSHLHQCVWLFWIVAIKVRTTEPWIVWFLDSWRVDYLMILMTCSKLSPVGPWAYEFRIIFFPSWGLFYYTTQQYQKSYWIPTWCTWFLIGCDLLTPTNPLDCNDSGRAQVGWRILWKVARWWVSWRLVINVATGGWWNWCWQTVEAFQVACWWVVGFYIQT